uniref:Uncharacterized protein n=1 Tax=Ananas comosus var. bracteatus TaxID=296719 RepID=A0A6V7Q789_ANACO|nr:unnamed protein product [Ananas comosus var. bracteatus]
MDCEPEELQFLGVVGIYREAGKLLHAWRGLFSKIALYLVFPLSVLFLAHIHISHILFSSIDSDDAAVERAPPGPRRRRASSIGSPRTGPRSSSSRRSTSSPSSRSPSSPPPPWSTPSPQCTPPRSSPSPRPLRRP